MVLLRNSKVRVGLKLSQSGTDTPESVLEAKTYAEHRNNRNQRTKHCSDKKVSFDQFAAVAKSQDSPETPSRQTTIWLRKHGYDDEVSSVGLHALRHVTCPAALLQRRQYFRVFERRLLETAS